jgi:hypothetical protein
VEAEVAVAFVPLVVLILSVDEGVEVLDVAKVVVVPLDPAVVELHNVSGMVVGLAGANVIKLFMAVIYDCF